jgi:hypothetical protein
MEVTPVACGIHSNPGFGQANPRGEYIVGQVRLYPVSVFTSRGGAELELADARSTCFVRPGPHHLAARQR